MRLSKLLKAGIPCKEKKRVMHISVGVNIWTWELILRIRIK